MYLAISMPAWLNDILIVYGDMIVPALVTILVALLSWLALNIKSSAKVNAVKADLQIEALKEVANREDNKPQLEEQSQKITSLEQKIDGLTDMFALAFQNSNLTPEIKSNLASLTNKIKYGTEDELIKDLENQNLVLEEQLESLKQQLTPNETPVQKEELKKRTRR